jgi:hypothetical protein
MRICLALSLVVLSWPVFAACDEEDQQTTTPAEGVERNEASAIKTAVLGVSCPEPNSIRCDTVRLSVTLREPAEHVRATIDGRAFPLELGECLSPQGGRNFCGPLHDAGLKGEGELAVNARRGRWIGHPPVRPEVRLTIRDPSGVVTNERFRTQLRAGFG